MNEICRKSFLNSFGVAIYIILVATFMRNADKLFGKQDSIISVAAFLLLFSLSAVVVGGLLVGKPIFLYIDGKKKDAVLMLLANAGWLLLFLIVALIVLKII